MRILIENSGIKAEIEVDDSSTLPDVIEHLEHLLKSVGYCFDGYLTLQQEERKN